MDGPDQILPADNIVCTSLDVPVILRPTDTDSFPPRSVPGIFDHICWRFRKRHALAQKIEGKWRKWTFGEYHQMVYNCAKGFLALGLTPHSVVCIMGFNSPEWFVADIAAIYAGGVAAGIYTTNSAEACFYCFSQCKAQIVVVEDEIQLDKVMKFKSKLPDLKAIIQYGGELTTPGVMKWRDLLKMGALSSSARLQLAMKGMAINHCCTLIYTSGTTGNPKGAMLSHDNIIYDALKIGKKLGIERYPKEKYVSYLPLSHVAGNVVEIICTFLHAVTVYFAQKDAFRGTLFQTFAEVRPTRIMSVPRVWEKVYEKFQEMAAKNRGLKRIISNWAKRQGRKNALAKELKRKNASAYCLANALVFHKVKKKLGIDKAKSIICGAAPVSLEVKTYFASLDILVHEGFGMSECSSLHCCNVTADFRMDSSGSSCPGMTTIIHKPNDAGEGELCILGRHNFMGYLSDLPKTVEAIDSSGVLHSGDIARITVEGFIYITGRIKEIIVTAGGENVAPVLIEQQIKAAMPFVGHAVVVGDRKKFLMVLLTFAAEVNEKQEPTDNLSGNVKNWLRSIGFEYNTMSQVMNSGPNPKIVSSLQEGINAANKQAISNAQKIQKFAVLPRDFSIATGELGPTMKVRRNIVAAMYKEVIDKVYEEATNA